MHAVVAMSPGVNVRELRQMLLGAGLDCSAQDCVAWADLPVRLAQVQASVVLFRLAGNKSVDWGVVQEARSLTMGPLVAIGPANEDWMQQAAACGVNEYVDEATLPTSLDETLKRLALAGAVRRPRGNVISVYAPSPGSGGTTVALNLAGALAEIYPKDIALFELSPDAGEMSLLLDITPIHTVEDVCRRWQNLDALSLLNSVVSHKAGLKALVNPIEQRSNTHLTAPAVRRMAVLAKMAFASTVLALESRVTEVEFEAMRLADHVVLVIRPDVPAVRRAQIAIEEADGHGIPLERIHLVVNRWGQAGQLKIPQIEASLGIKCLQLIPDDPGKVNRAVNKGVLLREIARHSTICRRFSALAAAFSSRTGKAKSWSWV